MKGLPPPSMRTSISSRPDALNTQLSAWNRLRTPTLTSSSTESSAMRPAPMIHGVCGRQRLYLLYLPAIYTFMYSYSISTVHGSSIADNGHNPCLERVAASMRLRTAAICWLFMGRFVTVCSWAGGSGGPQGGMGSLSRVSKTRDCIFSLKRAFRDLTGSLRFTLPSFISFSRSSSDLPSCLKIARTQNMLSVENECGNWASIIHVKTRRIETGDVAFVHGRNPGQAAGMAMSRTLSRRVLAWGSMQCTE
mmetsp:Transcript_111/g.386  ORF Transcript_111/g.386 Transcript_111/m.386 type:complete len:250 (+) Transcript_111:650-1399(+)